LPWAEFWYNSSFHTSMGMTPFKVLYGRDPPSIIPASINDDTPWDLQQQLQQRDQLLTTLKANLHKAQTRMKLYADKHRTDLQFSVGDYVFVKLQPYRQHSICLQRNHKLGMRYFGPFKVLSKIGYVAYMLELPPQAKIHPVFHVLVLKPCHGAPSDPIIPLPLQHFDDLADKVSLDGEGNVIPIREVSSGTKGQVAVHDEEGQVAPKFVRRSKRFVKIPARLRE